MNQLKHLSNDISAKMPRLSVITDDPMSRHCSFRIGGPAAVIAQPTCVEELHELCEILWNKGEKPLIIGNGTNVLVTDNPLERFVIKTDKMVGVERTDNTHITALAGTVLAKIANTSADSSLCGFEFAHGIPGSFGGAISMNAGAYGGEIKDVLQKVSYLNENFRISEKSASELELSYRHSVFTGSNCIILSGEIELTEGDEDEIRERMRELMEKRRSKQPLDKPSAGSTFKRPQNGYAAALIDEAGLKGYSIGGAQVSEKHAGFIINNGGATFDDVRHLMDYVCETVLKRTGIELEPEVRIIDNYR